MIRGRSEADAKAGILGKGNTGQKAGAQATWREVVIVRLEMSGGAKLGIVDLVLFKHFHPS